MSAQKQKMNRNIVLIALICLVLIAGSVGGAYAYLKANTDVLSNEFVPAKVTCSVEEEFQDGIKSNVKVRNTGNADAYIRATVVATYVAEDGKILATAPVEGVDYVITWGTEGWVKGTDGYWYHTKPVAPEAVTASLIESAEAVTAPEDYRLHLQILASGVQSAPDAAVQEAWGVTVTDGQLVLQ